MWPLSPEIGEGVLGLYRVPLSLQAHTCEDVFFLYFCIPWRPLQIISAVEIKANSRFPKKKRLKTTLLIPQAGVRRELPGWAKRASERVGLWNLSSCALLDLIERSARPWTGARDTGLSQAAYFNQSGNFSCRPPSQTTDLSPGIWWRGDDNVALIFRSVKNGWSAVSDDLSNFGWGHKASSCSVQVLAPLSCNRNLDSSSSFSYSRLSSGILFWSGRGSITPNLRDPMLGWDSNKSFN